MAIAEKWRTNQKLIRVQSLISSMFLSLNKEYQEGAKRKFIGRGATDLRHKSIRILLTSGGLQVKFVTNFVDMIECVDKKLNQFYDL